MSAVAAVAGMAGMASVAGVASWICDSGPLTSVASESLNRKPRLVVEETNPSSDLWVVDVWVTLLWGFGQRMGGEGRLRSNRG